MAADLGVEASAFAAAFRESYVERFTGATGSIEDTVDELAVRCGGSPSRAAVARAAARRLELIRSSLVAGDEALSVLDELRARGFRLGLVTDCSVETPTLWLQSTLAARFDAVAFSSSSGRTQARPGGLPGLSGKPWGAPRRVRLRRCRSAHAFTVVEGSFALRFRQGREGFAQATAALSPPAKRSPTEPMVGADEPVRLLVFECDGGDRVD